MVWGGKERDDKKKLANALIGDSHDGQIDVCRLVAMVIWSWTWNVANRDQNVPVGSTPTDTIGPRSRSRLSSRYVRVVLKWWKNRSIFKARRVFSFDIVQSDSFLCQPTDEHNRDAIACESDQSRLATIIVDVPVAVENLPVVWMAYKAGTDRLHFFLQRPFFSVWAYLVDVIWHKNKSEEGKN